MNASLDLFRQWTAQLRQVLPDLHGHRTKTLAFFTFGLVLSGKARLPLIAEELLAISSATTPSIERRLARFLANEQVSVVSIWARILAHLLPFFRGKRCWVVFDGAATYVALTTETAVAALKSCRDECGKVRLADEPETLTQRFMEAMAAQGTPFLCRPRF